MLKTDEKAFKQVKGILNHLFNLETPKIEIQPESSSKEDFEKSEDDNNEKTKKEQEMSGNPKCSNC
jgi:hypothetical protein